MISNHLHAVTMFIRRPLGGDAEANGDKVADTFFKQSKERDTAALMVAES